jgi:nucleotide-binding universal stress UspA family protein
MYSRILVPLDGSPTASRGLAQALRLAQALGSSLQLLHVVDVRRLPAETTEQSTPDRLVAAWRLAGERLLAAAAEEAREHGVAVDATVRADPTQRVSDLIVDEARRVGAGLIVMGTHGRRGLLRLALGSDAEAVLRDSPVPVLLVRAAEGDAATAPPLDR